MRNDCRRCSNRPYSTPARLPRYKIVPVKQQNAVDYLLNAVYMGDDLNVPFDNFIKDDTHKTQSTQNKQLTPKDARYYSTIFSDMYELN